MEAWKNELELEGEPYTDFHSLKPKLRDEVLVNEVFGCSHRTWVLVNYEALTSSYEISGNRWDVVILDESVQIKNPKASITKFCVKCFSDARYKAILTGLPNPESEMELFSQFQFLDGHFMGYKNFYHFRHALFELSPGESYKYVPKRGARAKIKQHIHERAFIMRRSQAGMGSKKVYERRYVTMNASQEKLYKSVVRDYCYLNIWKDTGVIPAIQSPDFIRREVTKACIKETQWAVTAALWLQRLTGGFEPEGNVCINFSKSDETIRIIQEDTLPEDQAVVWFKFRSELLVVLETMQRKGIIVAGVHGGMPQDLRESAIKLFRQGAAKVFLATEKCANMGIDLSTADTAIYYSNEWSCSVRLQSEARIDHPKKNIPLLYIDLVTKDTVDMSVTRRIRDKSFNARELLLQHLGGEIHES